MSEDFKCQADDTVKGDAVSANASSIERGAEAGAVQQEMERIRRLFYVKGGDAEDLISYAKEIVRLRSIEEPTLVGDDPPLQALHQPDIEKARAIVNWLNRNWNMDGPSLALELQGKIATALRAERERCARFVENWPHVHPNVSSSIAKGIRTGDTHG